MRRAARTDDNQKAIVDALRAVGCEVFVTSHVGGGYPDLMVLPPGAKAPMLMEVKDGSKPPGAQKLTPEQAKFHSYWPVVVVNSVDAALAAVRGGE